MIMMYQKLGKAGSLVAETMLIGIDLVMDFKMSDKGDSDDSF